MLKVERSGETRILKLIPQPVSQVKFAVPPPLAAKRQNRKCIAGSGTVAASGSMTGRRGIGRYAFAVERESDQGRATPQPP
jgi:hypothetical protein